MYNVQLNKGDILDVYLDYSDEINYEGKAILINKLDDIDSFYLSNERVIPTDLSNLSNIDKQHTIWYNQIKTTISKKEYIPIYEKIFRTVKRRINDYNEVRNILLHYKNLLQVFESNDKNRFKYKSLRTMFETIPIDFITRYFQQHNKKWQPSLFRAERWIVQFLNGNVTSRKIRYIQVNNPLENYRIDELRNKITYNNREGSHKVLNQNMNFTKIRYVKRYKDDYGEYL